MFYTENANIPNILYLSQKLIMRKFFLDRVMLCYDCMHWQVLQTTPPFFSFILPFVLLLFFHTETIGQQCGNEEPIESLYVSSKEMPLFPDGEKGLLDFLNENLKISSEKRVRAGSFVVAGVVNKLGEFQNVTIIQGTTGINDDIVRVCEMLRFTPGKQNGEFVEVLYSFSLHITYGGYITDLSFDTGISSERLWDMYFDAIDPYRNVTPYPDRTVTPELDTGPFYMVEKMPAYPGGNRELIKDIQENLVYPEDAKKEGLQGTVIFLFVIDKEGQITNLEIAYSTNHIFDSAALDVLSHLKTFIPGEQHGKKVNVYYTLPIMFNLDK